jgi:hypothetical protein
MQKTTRKKGFTKIDKDALLEKVLPRIKGCGDSRCHVVKIKEKLEDKESKFYEADVYFGGDEVINLIKVLINTIKNSQN